MLGSPYHCQGFELTDSIVAFMLLQCSTGISNRSAPGALLLVLSSSGCWDKTAPSPTPEASVSRMKGSSKFGNASIGDLVNNSFSLSNAA